MTGLHTGCVLVIHSQIVLQFFSKGLKDVIVLLQLFLSLRGESLFHIGQVFLQIVDSLFLLGNQLFLLSNKFSEDVHWNFLIAIFSDTELL